MVEIDNKIVSEELFKELFCCDLDKCRGICCVEGDSGAPLKIGEIEVIEEVLGEIKPFMSREGAAAVGRDGVFEVDDDGDYTTTLVDGKECAFVVMEDGVALCAIEKAFRAGKIDFIKPISCHLYPVRMKEFSNGTVGLNYHWWEICASARECGKSRGVRVYQGIREALIRAFGEEFYGHLEEVDRILENNEEEYL